MAATLQDLKTRLAGDNLLEKKLFADLDFDAVLNERDAPSFDAEWVRVDKMVRSTKKDKRLDTDRWQLIDEIREIAFMQAGIFAGQHEICSCVSDDFGLIATALALGHEDSWLNALWVSYKDGRIPCGKLEPIAGGLCDLI